MDTSASLLLLLLLAAVSIGEQGLDQYKYVTSDLTNETFSKEKDVSYWRKLSSNTLLDRLQIRPVEGVAKNVILFLGDGMSISTITAARIYMGQRLNLTGENSRLSFEEFPYTGLSKPYCVNKQVADSACSSTAYLGGVKANYGTMGVTAAVKRNDCAGSMEPQNQVDTILNWAQAAGKATGLVTTTRITHASPAGNFAHTSNRDWESDHDMLTGKGRGDPAVCPDIATQLVHHAPGKDIKVLLGGGRAKFMPANPLNAAWGEGERQDGRDLIQDWQEEKNNRGKAKYVSTREELKNVDTKRTDYLLGLFNRDHLLYNLEEGSEMQPTLAEMTEVAIKILKKEKKGFYLFVEGGLIDMAHHKNFAKRAFDETVEFHKAIKTAVDMVSQEDTLIVVTADHSHTMTMAGYAPRGGDILGAHQKAESDNLPYTTISYANGPSAQVNRTGLRRNVTLDDFQNETYAYPSLVNLFDETHGGEDVAVYAVGPWAHLLVGSIEQSIIPHVMAFAARLGPMAQLQRSSGTQALPLVILVLSLLSARHILQ